MKGESWVFWYSMRWPGAQEIVTWELRTTELSGRKSDPSSAERFVAEKTVLGEKMVAEKADSGKAADFGEGVQYTVAVAVELGSSAAVQVLNSPYIETEADLHQDL